MLLMIASLLMASLAFSRSFVPWPRIFNVTTTLGKQEAVSVMVVLICCLAAAMPLGIVQRVQLGYQEGFLNDIWQGIGSLLALAGLLTAVALRCGLPWLVLAVAGAPVFASGLNWISQFGFRRPWLFPKLANFDWSVSRALLSSGLLFFLLQIEYLLTFSSDNLIVAQLHGPGAVAQYAVTQKLFATVAIAQNCWLGPLWPAYSEAAARHDTAWVRRTLLRSIIGSAVWAGVASVLILVFGDTLFAFWLRGRVAPNFDLMLGLAVSTVLQCVGSAIAIYWLGTNTLRFVTLTGGALMLLAPILRVLLGRHFGLPGVAWGLTLAYLVCVVLPTAIYLPRALSSHNKPFVTAAP
jgi:O-antigen/teichoic acid export membrane protein